MDRTDTALAEYEPAFAGPADIAAWHMRAIACEAGNAYLKPGEREKLRRILQGTVAPMMAGNLAAMYDLGLEHDRLYRKPLAQFQDLILAPGTRAVVLKAFIEHKLPAGRPDYMKALFIEAAARQLGERWVGDSCDFIDVTIGTARLQDLIQTFAMETRNPVGTTIRPFAALMTPQGEQHTLTTHLLGLLFDTLGWSRTVVDPGPKNAAMLAATVARADVVCIGWSNERLAGEFQHLVSQIRRLSAGRRLPLVVGGAAALKSVDFLVEIGIDCVCDSVYSAARICKSFYDLEELNQQACAPGTPPAGKTDTGRTAIVSSSGIDWLSP